MEDTTTQTTGTDLPSDAGYDSGINEEVSSAFVHDPVLAEYQTNEFQEKWLKEFEAARKERKKFVEKGYKIIEHWADIRPEKSSRSNYNLFFANTELKLAAIYAQTPQPDCKRRFNDPNDQVSRVASLLIERKMSTELDEEDFDTTAKLICNDRLVPGIGVGWIRLEQEGGDDYLPYANEQVPETQPEVFPEQHPQAGQPTGNMVATGNMVPHPLKDLVAQTPVTSQCTPVDHVSWDDFWWSPCRTWKLCRWVARHLSMSEQAVQDMFGQSAPESTLAMLPYGEKSDETKNKQESIDNLRTKNDIEKTTSIFEIWDKELGLVWWFSESADVPLDIKEDANKFPGFFPTPRKPLGRFDTSNTVPLPDYHFVQDLYRRADSLNNRACSMEEAAQVKFVYDNACPELKDMLTTTSELQGIGVAGWQSFVGEKGGIAGSMQFLPIEDMVKAAQVLTQQLELVETQILKIEGLSGPFQGESTPNETVLATQQKAAFGTSRLSITQKDVAKYFQEILRLKAHLMCKFYTDEQWQQGVGTLTPEDMKLVPQAIQLLRNEQLRNFDLIVSVDSIQLPNWNLEKADKTAAFTAIMSALQQILPAVQQNPTLAPLALKSIGWLITGYKGAQYIEGEIDTQLQLLAQAAQQKGQKPPPPNPAEIQQSIANQRSQTDLQIASLEESTKQRESQQQADIDKQKLALKANEQRIQEKKIDLQAHDDAKNSVHSMAMDRVGAQNDQQPPVIPIPVPVGHDGKMPHHITAIIGPGQ